MNAQQLADLLRTQAAPAPHQIRLNDAVLGTSGLDARVRGDLLRGDGTLVLTVDPAAIPASPPAAGFTLAARVPEGLDGFLALDERDAEVTLSVDGTVSVALTVHPRRSGGAAAAWALSDSFAELAYRAFDALSLADPKLELSTGGAGLSFSASLTLDGLFATLAQFIGASTSTQFTLGGTLERGPLGLGFDLGAPLTAVADKALGDLLTMKALRVGAALVPFQLEDGSIDALTQLYLGATVTVGTASFDLRAALPLSPGDSRILLFRVVPTPGYTATLSSLGSLLAGQTWTGFFSGPAAALQAYFNTFALKGYGTAFSLGAGRPVSITVNAGTTTPWTLWGSYTLTLDATWQILYLSATQTISTLALTSVFSFNGVAFDVEVRVPDLAITGRQRGSGLVLSLDELNQTLFQGAFPLPEGLLDVSVRGLWLEIDVARKHFAVGAAASASVAPFGTPLLAIRGMAISVDVDASGAHNTYAARLSGEVSLGGLTVFTDATLSSQAGADTVFSLHLVDETVGSMLNRLAHLVDPTFDLTLPEPWDAFLEVPLDALALEVNLTRGSVSAACEATLIDLGFLELTRVKMAYTRAKAGKAAQVRVEVEGNFLGEEYGAGKAHPALGWDAINDRPPAVPGAGSLLFDLKYLGLGQRVGFATAPAPTLLGVMEALKRALVPTEPGRLPPLGQEGGLLFREDVEWMIGAQLGVLGTLDFSVVFMDPALYGLRVELSGARAGTFAGLKFELFYRKVTDTIGVYHVELQLPDAMRTLQLGAATLTLPVVTVDCYTNGSFRVDLGFPAGLDFSRGFSLQMGLLIGRGGMYFARLDPATSSRVPAIANGTWSPVVELGFALSVGVGRTINEGILSGGLSVEVVGTLEGVLAWFHPTDGSPEETYHWLQGSVAVVGRLYAIIDFAVIQASLDVTAYAAVVLTIESHQPVYIALSAGVSVQVSVTIIGITFDLSFSTTVSASYVIGEASATPWKLAGAGGAATRALSPSAAGARLPQRSPTFPAGLLPSLFVDAAPPGGALTAWPAVGVFAEGKRTLPVFAAVSFTRPDTWALASGSRVGGVATFTTATPHDLMAGDAVVIAGAGDPSFNGAFAVATSPDDRRFTLALAGNDGVSPGGTVTLAPAAGTAAAVLLLAVRNSIAPRASTPAQRRALSGADPASAPFNLLMRAMLAWGIHVETVWPVAYAARAGGVVTVTTGAPHRLAPGDTVVLSGSGTASFRGAFTVAATPAAGTFTFAQAGSDATGSGGTARYVAAAASIVTAARAGGTVTVTTAQPHGLSAGDPVVIAGVGDASFDGTFAVATVTGGTTFTCAQPALGDASAPGGWAAAPGVTAGQLADLRAQLQDPATTAAAFDYATLTAFLAENFTFQLSAAGDAGLEAGVALFPMLPALALSDTAGTSVDFSAQTPVDMAYRAKVQAYFRHLQAQFESRQEAGDASSNLLELPPSMATVVFSQYFAMLMRSAARAALGVLAEYPFTTPHDGMPQPAGMSIQGVATALGDPSLADDPMRVVVPNQAKPVLNPFTLLALDGVARPVHAGDTLSGIAAALAGAGALNPQGGTVSAHDLLAANERAQGIFTPGAPVSFSGITCTARTGDTLARISVRLLLRASGMATLNVLSGLRAATEALIAANAALTSATQALPAGMVLVIPGGPYTTVAGDTLNGIATAHGAPSVDAYVASLRTLNPGISATTPSATVLAAGTALTLPAGTYTTVAGDTPTWVAGYGAALAQGAFDVGGYVAALLALNTTLAQKSPAAAQDAGTSITLPPVTRRLSAGDTVASLATTLVTTTAVVKTALLAVPAATALLSPGGTLAAPLRYPVAPGDTFARIAARFGGTLREVANAALHAGAIFAGGTTITVLSVPAVRVATLNAALLGTSAWNTASGMVSRFLLGGLRLPHPGDPAFADLTVADLADPTRLAGIVTRPMFALTGQQFPLAAPAPEGYQATLSNPSAASWVDLGTSGSLALALTDAQKALLGTVAGTPPAPAISHVSRLPLFRMVPPRAALQARVSWQAASPPLACTPAVAGSPSLWALPDTLLRQVRAATRPDAAPLYELVTARHAGTGTAVETAEASCYAWATRVDFTVSLPAPNGPAPAAANAYVVGFADDAGAARLRQLYDALAAPGAPPATLHLLHPPNPAAGSTAGLRSDLLDPARTFLLRTNLSPLTRSGVGGLSLLDLAPAPPAEVDAARLSDTAPFVRLLWEASVTRSGGFYLNYAASGSGAPLPADVFGTGTKATLTLVAILGAQTGGQDAAIRAFHNCAVLRDPVDPATSTVLVQPATWTVGADASLAAAATGLNAAWGTSLTAADVGQRNRAVPLVLRPGAALALPAGGTHAVDRGDTLASVAAAHGTTVAGLLAAGGNTTAQILARGALLQLAEGVLRPQATASPGTAGFEVTRANPDPANLPHDQMSAAQVVDSLFHLLGWTMAGGSAFHASGAGLPTTPADRLAAGPDGAPRPPADHETADTWAYEQTLSVAAFAKVQRGSASPALPPPAANPYNGVGTDGAPSRAVVDLDLQDIYGNLQPMPAPLAHVALPVGYLDDVAGLSAWPSLGMAWTVSGAPPAPSPKLTLALTLGMQQARYVPAPATPADTALGAAAADRAAYARIVYQLAQPDVQLALATTLDQDPELHPRRYGLPRDAFASFAQGAYVYLAAMAALQPVVVECDGATPASTVAAGYGLTLAQLFAANGARPYAALFGGAALAVPRFHPTLPDETPTSIAEGPGAGFGLTGASLAQQNAALPLRPGADLAAPQRSVIARPNDSLAAMAARVHAAVEAIAALNAATAPLEPGALLAWGTASYTARPGDTLAAAAAALGATPVQLAAANRDAQGIFPLGTALRVADVLAGEGDTLAGLAELLATSVATLASSSAETANLWAPGTAVYLGADPSPAPPLEGDTLASFAAANRVTPEQLAAANPGAAFAAGAGVAVPGALQHPGGGYATYAARPGDTLGGIATRFGVQAADLAALNPDRPGLFAAGQAVQAAASPHRVVVTQAGDTFQALVTRFAGAGVTTQLSAVAGWVAGQAGLLAPGGLWITPPMRADGGGSNAARTLAGVADAYGTTVETLAAANAAVLGVIAPGLTLSLGEPALVTGAHETLGSIANRLAQQGTRRGVAEVAASLAQVPGLVAAGARLLPVPPPSPAGLAVTVTPRFTARVFPITVDVLVSRNPLWIDPDFAGAATVAEAATPVLPRPDAGDTPRFHDFAAALQAALPGVRLATGAAPANAGTSFWGVNFGSAAGPAVTWTFQGGDAVTFALPPLSTSLVGGTADVFPYTRGAGLAANAQPRSFDAVDLDVWLNTFLEAVDTFLAPSHAVPAFATGTEATAAERAVVRVVEDKRTLAGALARRVKAVLAGESGSLAGAQEAMEQALLARLSAAFTVGALVQVPVAVAGGEGTALTAPRLSGRLAVTGAGEGAEGQPAAFTFSTARVPLVGPEPPAGSATSAATFLLGVTSPARHRQAQLDLRYVATEMEIPDPGSVLGDYEGSSWLTFVLPLDLPGARIGGVNIPLPLRAYPSPATLVAQSARQSLADPHHASRILAWDFGFVYHHDDAGQDTPLVVVAFNGDPTGPVTGAQSDPTLAGVFTALAKFMAVYPELQGDLALLPLQDPAAPDAAVQAAVQAFATLVRGVADAFSPALDADLYVPPVETFAWRLEKEQDALGGLTRLRMISVDPETGTAQANPVALWPQVYATVGGAEVALAAEGTPAETDTAATYAYPAGIAADAALPQRFVFSWPDAPAGLDTAPWPPLPPAVELPGPQTFAFLGIDPLSRQSGRAGVSIARNLTLIPGKATADAFVYRTPLAAFAAGVAPSVVAGGVINLGEPPLELGEALGGFLQQLFTARDSWTGTDQVNVRLAVAYEYPVAEGGLPVRVPVLLVPGHLFAPQTDWDAADAGSFTAQVVAGIAAWAEGKTLRADGSYVVDLTIYASKGLLQPLVRATTLQYRLSAA